MNIQLQFQLKKGIRFRSLLFIIIPLVLSAYTHLWNPTGFPSIHVDEGHYLRKAMSTETGQGLQPQDRYRAPYFGQIFLAGIYGIIDYPNIEKPVSASNVEQLYFVPRVIMGLLAIIDTYLIYRITEVRYGRNIAIISSILFAVIPYTWMTRRILLESIQLPFILTSILLVLNLNKEQQQQNKKLILIISGIFMGLAIFTKLPAFTIIPLGIVMIYILTRNKKNVLFWLIPVILVPLLWPMHATLNGDFDKWFEGVSYQTTRQSKPLLDTLNTLFQMDPVIVILGFGGLIFSAIRRDYFLLLWTIPVFIFLQLIDFVSSFHLLLLLPPFCIAGGNMIGNIGTNLSNIRMRKILPYLRITIIGIFGIISMTMLITLDTNSSYYKAVGFVTSSLPDNTDNSNGSKTSDKVTLVGNPKYFWIPDLVFNKIFDSKSYYSKTPFKTDKYMMVIDKGFLNILDNNSSRLNLAYNSSHNLITFEQNLTGHLDIDRYPYTNLKQSPETRVIELRNNY